MDPEKIKEFVDALIKKSIEDKPDMTPEELDSAVQKAVAEAIGSSENPEDVSKGLANEEQAKLIDEQVKKSVDEAVAAIEQERKLAEAIQKALTNVKPLKKSADEKAAVRLAPIGASGPAILTKRAAPSGRRVGIVPEDEFSFVRMCKHMSNNDYDAAQEEIAKDLVGIEKTMNSDNLEDGGISVPSPTAARLIDVLRAKTVTDKAGMTSQPMTDGTLTIPVLAQDAGVFWGMEQNEELVEGEGLKFDGRGLVLKDLTALIPISNRLLEDSTFDMERRLQESIIKKLHLALDKARLVGTGGNMPIGLESFSGCTAVSGVTLANFDLEAVREFIHQAQLVESELTGFIMHPTLLHQLQGEKDGNGRPIYNENPAPGQNRTLYGYPVWDTTQCKNTATATNLLCFGGDFSEVLLGNKGGIKIDVSKDVGFKSNQTWIRVMMREDLTIEHPATIVRQTIDAS